MYTEKELTEMCTGICKEVGHKFDIPVKINKRLTSTLARVMYVSFGENYIKSEMIEFSAKFLESADADAVMKVARHECAHYLVTETTHEKHGHDKMFKEMCKKLKCQNDKVYFEYTKTIPDTEFYKYIVKCQECGAIVGKYHRAGKVVKNINNYRCKCGGCLSIVTE